MMSLKFATIGLPLLWLLLAGPGCQEQARGPRTRPATPAPVATQPAVADAPADDQQPPARPPEPKRPKDTWVVFRKALDSDKDATCVARWTGGNRLEVATTNIRRITLDLTKLPEGAPTQGPWNLQIDGQGIEMTGFRPKPGYTGMKRDLIRSENGNWTVDRKTLYRAGA